jgi:hypothetical protein
MGNIPIYTKYTALKQQNTLDKKFCLIFAKKTAKQMETTKKNTGLFWILFLISVVLFFVVLYSPYGSWVSMMLPFNVTFFAKALDLL